MTVRSVTASGPCARTIARLDGGITVARTGESTVLLNLPRSIGEIDARVREPRRGGVVTRVRRLFG